MPTTQPIKQETKFVKSCSAPDVDADINKAVFIEWILKDNRLHVHIFKPAEKPIRLQEFQAKKLCDAPWPLSNDSAVRRKQLSCQAELEKCEARRQAWRTVKWPDIESTIRQVLHMSAMDVYDYEIEFVPSMDGWHIVFEEGHIIYKKKIEDFISSLMDYITDYFNYKKWEWPKEIRK